MSSILPLKFFFKFLTNKLKGLRSSIQKEDDAPSEDAGGRYKMKAAD